MSLTETNVRPPWHHRMAQMDRVLLAIAVIFVALVVLVPAQAMASLQFVGAALTTTGPFLVLSIVIAAYAGASGADNLIGRAFQGRTVPMIFVAALFGALSPFCSCGVIPIIAALLTMGVPLAPVMAFWLASPIMDPSMFVLTSAVLDPTFAMSKTAIAVGLGLLGGFGIHALTKLGLFNDPLRPEIGAPGCSASAVTAPKPVVWAFWRDAGRREKFGREALKVAFFLGKWLTLAFVLESLMVAYVPASWITTALAGDGIAPIALATILGVPAYLNGYAALPLVSGLIDQGMAPGAGMAFLVAGGVTSLPAAIAVFALVKRPVFLAYLGFALGGSLTAGLMFQALVG